VKTEEFEEIGRMTFLSRKSKTVLRTTFLISSSIGIINSVVVVGFYFYFYQIHEKNIYGLRILILFSISIIIIIIIIIIMKSSVDLIDNNYIVITYVIPLRSAGFAITLNYHHPPSGLIFSIIYILVSC
jgi:hypothetical protein